MQNKKFNRMAVLAIALVLSVVIVAGCGAASKGSGKNVEQNKEQNDTTEFRPTHPPVVVPHTWKEAK